MTDWTQVITNFLLISGGAVAFVTTIDKVAKYFNKRKDKGITDAVQALRDDVAEIKETATDSRAWIKKLEDDLDYLMKLLLNKSLK